MWPEMEPIDIHGPASVEPAENVYTDSGDHIRTWADLEHAVPGGDGERVYTSEKAKQFVEWRDGKLSVDS